MNKNKKVEWQRLNEEHQQQKIANGEPPYQGWVSWSVFRNPIKHDVVFGEGGIGRPIRCYYCDVPQQSIKLANTAGGKCAMELDRLDTTITENDGYVIGNCVWACRSCNGSKQESIVNYDWQKNTSKRFKHPCMDGCTCRQDSPSLTPHRTKPSATSHEHGPATTLKARQRDRSEIEEAKHGQMILPNILPTKVQSKVF